MLSAGHQRSVLMQAKITSIINNCVKLKNPMTKEKASLFDKKRHVSHLTTANNILRLYVSTKNTSVN